MSADGRAPPEPGNIPTKDVHEHRLGNIIRIMACEDVVGLHKCRASIKCLAPEDPAESTVVLLTDCLDDGVHGPPSVELFIADDLEGERVLDLIPLDRFKRVVPVPTNSLVNGKQKKIETVIMSIVKSLDDVGQDGGVLAS